MTQAEQSHGAANTWPGEPTAHLLRPPRSLIGKMHYYFRRYGAVHAACALIGRWFPPLWTLAGPLVSTPYLRRWLRSPGRKCINLGGGSLVSEEWLCADVDPRADAYLDLRGSLRLSDESVDAVFLEEALEHVDAAQGARLLRECARILRPGGQLRLSTPDLQYFAEQCLRAPEGAARINEVFYGHGHRRLYGPEEVRQALQAAEFVAITRSTYRDSRSPLGRFDSHAARFGHVPEISQYWDARKRSDR
ncbi:MAG TPA: methyltransferase domain-containing protein [Gemmatimonadaceae bacterium]|nr:methyltransferase domain-containing protein [Gemmatimonadaceae bacterium]